jgi:hypothetical protein
MIYVPVNKLKELCDPYLYPPWGVKVPKTKVQKAINWGDLLEVPISSLRTNGRKPTANDHAARIAYFIVNGFEDPISLDVGIPTMGYSMDWILTDGHHRLAAAIFANLATVPVEFSGEVEFFKELFGISDWDLPWNDDTVSIPT